MTRQGKEQAILAECERDAVIAELDRLCKQDGIMEVSPGLWVKGYKQYQLSIGWFDCFTIDVDGNERRVFKIHARLPDSHPYWFVAHLVLRLETRALEEEIKRLRDGIRKVASLTNYPEIALQYLDPPTP